MRKLRLLSIGVGAASETVPLGAACVASALRRAFGDQMDVTLIEGDQGEDYRAIVARTLGAESAYLGLSIYAWNREAMVLVARELRRRDPRALVFAGGPEATADPWSLLDDAPFDFVVVGEGEVTAVEALRALSAEPGTSDHRERGLRVALAGIAGVAVPGGQNDFRKRPGSKAESLPSPWLDGSVSGEGRDEVVWELSRGCAFHCAYCFEGRGEGGVRVFPRARIEAELEVFVRTGVRRLFVLDPTFNWKRERALDLLSLFAEKGRGITWKFEARAELLDRSLAKAFARLDASLQIGLQSARKEVLDKVGRPGFDARRFAEKLSLLDAEGLTWGLDLIYGLPGDDLRGFKKSLAYALCLQPNQLDVFPLALLPGTELAERARDLGLVAEAVAPHLLVESPGFSREDMEKAGRLAQACDLFYSRGRAVSWFQRALSPLDARPSTFLSRFGDWLPGRAKSEGVESLQLGFLEEEYRARGLAEVWPLLSDIVRFEGAWGRAIAEGLTSELRLSHDADAIIDPPGSDLVELAARLQRRPSRLRVAPGKQGPKVTILKK